MAHKDGAETEVKKPQFFAKKGYNFRNSAIVATVIAVILLGSSIFLFAKNQDQNQQISTLKEQVSSLQTDAKKVDVEQNGVKYDGETGKTALELLKNSHKVDVNNTSYGEMVIGIDGVKADSAHFWEFDVNGQMANEGAGTYQTKNGEQISWKLTALN